MALQAIEAKSGKSNRLMKPYDNRPPFPLKVESGVEKTSLYVEC